MKSIKLLALAFIASLTFSSCSDDKEPVKEVEEEVITTLIVTLKNGDETVTLKSYDADGEGPGEPKLTVSGNLKKNTTYTGTIKLLNETEKPAENVTEEVEEEALEHQFFYSSTIGTFVYKDADSKGNPIGIKFELKTNDAAATGKATFKLVHEPNKTATGVKEGNSDNAGGSTDVEATFDVTVE